MTSLALLLVFPLVWPFIARFIWKHEITWGEAAINLAVVAVIVVAGWYGGRYSQMADTEILNGQLTSKSADHVSCSHDYSCRCRNVCTGTGKSRSCSRKCDTCYEHSYDQNWNLHTTLGDLTVARVDRQGLVEPPRYTQAAIGDPVAQTHAYTNYIKAAPDSLLSTIEEQKALPQFQSLLPAYPDQVYDYHYVNRVLPLGVALPDVAQWNRDLAMRLRTLGPAKQVNAIVVLAKQKDPQFAAALRAAWLGGKKNDVVVVLGTPNYPAIEWVRVFSWTDEELFKVQLRDELRELQTVDREKVLSVIERRISKQFSRKHMKDFDYLLNAIEPPTWLLALLFGVSVLSSIGLSMFLARNDVRPGGFAGGRMRFSRR